MKHRIDWLSLMAGLLFGVVAIATFNGWITVGLLTQELLLPVGLVVAGLLIAAIVVTGVRAGRGAGSVEQASPDQPVRRSDDPSDTDPSPTT